MTCVVYDTCSLVTFIEHHQRLQGQVVYPVQGTHSLNFQVNFICGLKCAYATTQSRVYYCNTTYRVTHT